MEGKASLVEFRENLRALEREMEQELLDQTGKCGISPAQRQLILALRERSGAGVTELAQTLSLDKSTLSRGLEALRERGLAETIRDSSDRRSVKARLTAQGLAAADRIDAFCDKRYGGILEGLGDRDRASVLRGVRILAEILRESRPEAGA